MGRTGPGDPGGTIKIRIWLVTRERATWIAGAEIFVLAMVLLAGPGTLIRVLVGLPVLAHLGYTALTSLPLGEIPGRPAGKRPRRNQELRSNVVGFLNEVRRVEEFHQQAVTAGIPQEIVDQNIREAQQRVMAAAARVAKATGRISVQEEVESPGRGRQTLLTHAPPSAPPTPAH